MPLRRPRPPRIVALGPLHKEMISWLRANALGVERARPRAELLAHLVAWSAADPLRPRILVDMQPGEAGDWDRQMRAIAHECFTLHYAVLSCGRGYFYGRAGVARDWRAARHQSIRKMLAEVRTQRLLAQVREAEGRREEGKVQAVQLELGLVAA